MKRIIYTIMLMMLLILPVSVQAKKIRIMIDPGHGGKQDGAISYDGKTKEKDINLKIALKLRDILEKDYKDVEVFMTREDDKEVALDRRVLMGKEKDCDFVVSIHNNAIAEKPAYDNGATILVASGNSEKKIAKETQKMGANIIGELEELGLENRGLLIRYAMDNAKYENGELMDHYKIIRYGIINKIPSIIVEHAFVDNKEEFKEYLKDDEKLEALAYADAKGIARYFELEEKDTGDKLKPVEGTEVELVYMDSDDWTKTKKETKIFYKAKKEEEEKTEATTQQTEEVESVDPIETTEVKEITEANTEIKYVENTNKPDMGGDKIEESNLEDIQDLPTEKKFDIIKIGIGLLCLITAFVFVIKKLRS